MCDFTKIIFNYTVDLSFLKRDLECFILFVLKRYYVTTFDSYVPRRPTFLTVYRSWLLEWTFHDRLKRSKTITFTLQKQKINCTFIKKQGLCNTSLRRIQLNNLGNYIWKKNPKSCNFQYAWTNLFHRNFNKII